MEHTPLTSRHILLGVTGSIAAFKAPDLASKLTQAGADVDVVLTQAATHFVSPLTFQSVTGRPAYTDADLWGPQAHVLHVGLGRSAELLIIAPASANTLAKLASGAASDLLSLTALAAHCPLLIAPAMDGGMYEHPATQENLRLLAERGATILGPEMGHLASGLSGIGRMTEPGEILAHVRFLLSRGGSLGGRKVVVTAGGTQEPLDPVRVLTNLSSGKQGYALAQAALDAGADVILIAAPTGLTPPAGAVLVPVRTADEMHAAVSRAAEEADVLLMAAAVADFRPAQPASQKMKKEKGAPSLQLEATPDILSAMAERRRAHGRPRVVVGFAAETQDVVKNAQAKLKSKALDLIVANDVSQADSGFGSDTNRATLIDAGGKIEELPLLSKMEVAEIVIARVAGMLAA
jgi:phosphopantothenoylcysteine decarboxylase/phosphopantothenate--cysteine ligase